MKTPEQSGLRCPICSGETDPGECCGYEGTRDGWERQEAAKIECAELANALYPKPEPTALAVAIVSAQLGAEKAVTKSMKSEIDTQSTAKQDRRKRVIYVPENYVLALLSRGFVKYKVIMVPEPLGLPSTATAVAVFSDWSRNAFAIVVYDPSFEDIPDGEQIPEMKVDWSYVRIGIEDRA